MSGGNSTSHFELFFMCLWIVVTIALIVLVALKKIQFPNIIKGNKNLSILFAFLQLCVFVLTLAALGDDNWSIYSYPNGGWWTTGLVRTRSSFESGSRAYDCSNAAEGYSTSCRTVQAAGAFTLIFGLLAIFTSFALLIIVSLSLFGVGAIDRAKPFVSILANVQWVALLAMVMIWGISGHDVLIQQNGDRSNYRIGDSWVLVFVATIIAIGSAFFFAGGAGESVKGGEASAPAETPGPAQQV